MQFQRTSGGPELDHDGILHGGNQLVVCGLEGANTREGTTVVRG